MAITARVPCNWKVIQDNFHESYHLETVHPELQTSIEERYQDTQFDLSAEGHNRMIMRAGLPSRGLPGGPALREPLLSMLRAWELDPESFVGREYETRRAIQERMRERGPGQGHHHYEDLRDEQLTDPHHYNLFPNCSVTFGPDSVLLQRVGLNAPSIR